MDKVVGEYTKEHVSRNTQMTRNEAAQNSNRDVVKTNLETWSQPARVTTPKP